MARAKKKTHDEYYIGVEKRFDKGRLWNAMMWHPRYQNRKLSERYASTLEEAKEVLNYAYKLWNGKKVYDSNGKRYETHTAGMIGISVEHDVKSDRDQEIVRHVIKKRTVTEWEVVDES